MLVFFPQYGCTTNEQEKTPEPPSPVFYGPQFTKEGELSFLDRNKREIITIDIEMPDTPEERSMGLMFRTVMAETEGMLFVNDMSKNLFFWMKNTYIPLDMVFVDRKMKIVKIERNTIPLSESLIPVPGEAQYTIEVNAGFCDRHGIKIGDSVYTEKIR